MSYPLHLVLACNWGAESKGGSTYEEPRTALDRGGLAKPVHEGVIWERECKGGNMRREGYFVKFFSFLFLPPPFSQNFQ